jgi:hypothetical protein
LPSFISNLLSSNLHSLPHPQNTHKIKPKHKKKATVFFVNLWVGNLVSLEFFLEKSAGCVS